MMLTFAKAIWSLLKQFGIAILTNWCACRLCVPDPIEVNDLPQIVHIAYPDGFLCFGYVDILTIFGQKLRLIFAVGKYLIILNISAKILTNVKTQHQEEWL